MSVDFPADGIPIIPISATSLSSSCRSHSPGISPSSANAGACLVLEQKCAFPYPPLPHSATRTFIPLVSRSNRSSPEFTSFTSVPVGTMSMRSSPLTPCMSCFPPLCPFSALSTFLCLYSLRVLMLSSDCIYTAQPFPPSPPRGPHFGMYFSRLHETRPSHHFQAVTWILTSSMNILFLK